MSSIGHTLIKTLYIDYLSADNFVSDLLYFLLSLFIFLLAISSVMKTATKLRKQYPVYMMDILNDTLALSSQNCQQKQDKTMMLADTSSQVLQGVNIDKGKAKTFKAISTGKERVTFEGNALGEVKCCTS